MNNSPKKYTQFYIETYKIMLIRSNSKRTIGILFCIIPGAHEKKNTSCDPDYTDGELKYLYISVYKKYNMNTLKTWGKKNNDLEVP